MSISVSDFVRRGVLALIAVMVSLSVTSAIVSDQPLTPDAVGSIASSTHHLPIKAQPVHPVRQSHSPRSSRDGCTAAALTEAPSLLHALGSETDDSYVIASSLAVRRLSLLSSLRI